MKSIKELFSLTLLVTVLGSPVLNAMKFRDFRNYNFASVEQLDEAYNSMSEQSQELAKTNYEKRRKALKPHFLWEHKGKVAFGVVAATAFSAFAAKQGWFGEKAQDMVSSVFAKVGNFFQQSIEKVSLWKNKSGKPEHSTTISGYKSMAQISPQKQLISTARGVRK